MSYKPDPILTWWHGPIVAPIVVVLGYLAMRWKLASQWSYGVFEVMCAFAAGWLGGYFLWAYPPRWFEFVVATASAVYFAQRGFQNFKEGKSKRWPST